MKQNYSFLKDELALIEIQKHKWIESEKAGREIGFASAAIDWTKKYGQEFLRFRFSLKSSDLFAEKRQHRRFNYSAPVQITIGSHHFLSTTTDVNLVGISCTIPSFFPNNTETNVSLNLFGNTNRHSQRLVHFKSRVSRIAQQTVEKIGTYYTIFLPFDERIRTFIKSNTQLFLQQA